MKIKPDLIESFSGIRGIYGQSITKELAYKYAWHYCKLFKNKISKLVISGDSRRSTPTLKRAMIRAFSDLGLEKIIDVGIVPVQVCEYAIPKFKASGGVYITASHNEPEYNGWKFLKKDGALLYPEQIAKLIKKVHQKPKLISGIIESKTKLINKNKEAIDDYINFVLKKIGKKWIAEIKKSKFKILVDPNGGSGITILNKLFKKLDVETKFINKKLGQFVRLVEPNLKSLANLSREIKNSKFEFGCGFDCDADRVEFVASSGQMVSGQYILALACDNYLTSTKKQIVVTNDCTSCLVRDIVKRHKAKTKEAEVGEMNVVKKMEKQKSIIGGEGSCGGVIIPPIKCRDGIMTTALILKMMAQKGKSLVDILKDYPKYYSERTKMNCLPSETIKIKNKLEKYFRNKNYKIKKTGGLSGGLKVLIDKNSYIWFRQSKTEPGVFRIITDGDDYRKIKKLLKEGIKLFNKFKKN